MEKQHLPIAIIGAGPVGLAAAAQLHRRKLPFIIFEGGTSVGNNLRSWGHVSVFSPWKYNIDEAAKALLQASHWKAPDKDALATGNEIVSQYLQPLADLPQIKPYLRLNTKVLTINRKGIDKMKTYGREQRPFSIKVEVQGNYQYYEASAVIDASGTWNQPNPIGSGGVWAQGEEQLKDHIFYGIPDIKGIHLERYKNKSIAVVGSGYSAINALLDLAEIQEQYPETKISWILRKEQVREVYGGQENDALEGRGKLGIRIQTLVDSGRLHIYTPFHILEVATHQHKIQLIGKHREEDTVLKDIDEIISNTGSRPNLNMLREVRVDLDAALESVFDLATLIDPNIHSCGTVRPHGERELRHPEKDFYIVGSKSYGRAPTFLMATGYEQVRSIAAYLAGDKQEAKEVALNLPETGVCSSGIGTSENTVACCEPPSSPTPKNSVANSCGC